MAQKPHHVRLQGAREELSEREVAAMREAVTGRSTHMMIDPFSCEVDRDVLPPSSQEAKIDDRTLRSLRQAHVTAGGQSKEHGKRVEQETKQRRKLRGDWMSRSRQMLPQGRREVWLRRVLLSDERTLHRCYTGSVTQVRNKNAASLVYISILQHS
eukprot:767757-Hanusia_phi.AAC.2